MSDWCELDFGISVRPCKRAAFLLSSSLFYMPNYVKTYARLGAKDETHQKQGAFMEAIRYYERLFSENQWFQGNVLLRLYFDSSLLLYRAPDGSRPWRGVLARLRSNPHVQLVRFSCRLPELCREPTDAPGGEGGRLHRGLFGALVRMHAATDFPEGTKCVCLIDMDSLYTKRWWQRNAEFMAAPDQQVLGFTGIFEMNLHGYLPAETRDVPPFLKCGLTSFKKPLDADSWRMFPALFEALLPSLRYKDAVRQQLFGDKSMDERFFEDFGYGADEAVLNAVVVHQFRLSQVRVVPLTRGATAVGTFFEKLAAFMRWNNERSAAMRGLARALGLGGARDVIKMVETEGARCKSFADLGRFVQRMRPFLPHMLRMQIDARVLNVIRSFDAKLYAGAEASNNYIVPAAAAGRNRQLLPSGAFSPTQAHL